MKKTPWHKHKPLAPRPQPSLAALGSAPCCQQKPDSAHVRNTVVLLLACGLLTHTPTWMLL